MARYSVLLDRDPESGVFVVTIPTFPDLVTEADSYDEALEMARDVIRLHIAGLQRDGEEVPIEHAPPVLATVDVDLATASEGVEFFDRVKQPA
jgi:predicted RNase H-like HicB family nuclease